MMKFGFYCPAATLLVAIAPGVRGRGISFQLQDRLINTNTLHRTSKARIVQDDLDFFPSVDFDNHNHHDDDDDDKASSLVELSRNDAAFGRVVTPLEVIRPERGELQLSFTSSIAADADVDANDRAATSTATSASLLSPAARSRIFRSTGTTICGILVGSQYVILGADTRATDDRMVADKRCEKIHHLARNLYACGAGTSADLDMVTRQVQYRLRLQDQQERSIGNGPTATVPSVSGACRMLRDILYEGGGNIGANLIVGGHESGKATLVAIHPHGSMDVVPFSALGSGGLAAMAVLEQGYRSDLTLDEGTDLVKRAITAGIQNDLGSGSQVDLLILGPDDFVHYQRGAIPEEQGEVRRQVDTMSDGQGVNGFGNSPYQVQSRRIVASIDESAEVEKWNELLGL
jgi:20S proteasome subunit beta 2